MRWMRVFAIAGVATLVACSGDDPKDDPEGCAVNTDCDAAEACVGGECVKLCVIDSDCPAGEFCDALGKCQVPAADGPDIQTVVGNDPDTGTRVLDGLVITGARLADAEFELTTGSTVIPLVVRDAAADRAEVVFPADILSGQYTLVAANAAGLDQETVTLTLPELNGDIILSRLNSVATGDIAFALIPVGTSAVTVAVGNHEHDADYAGLVHDHGTDYAAGDHDHAGVYAEEVHAHDLAYSAIDHDHAGDYADAVHDHDTDYYTRIEADTEFATKAEVIGEAWGSLPLATDFQPYGGTYQAPEYRLVGDVVCLRGLATYTSGAITDATVLAVLPVGYRPPGRHTFRTGGTDDRIDVLVDGDVVVQQSDGGSFASVDGVCFSISP